MTMLTPRLLAGLAASAIVFGASVTAGQAPPEGQAPSAGTPGRGRGNQEPGPTITVRGRTFTQRELFQRNVGGSDDQTAQFPPHKIIGNINYVGTRSLSAFLVVTPQGNILINSTYERNVPTIQRSVEQLGFKFSDTRILLGSHAHGDHQEGDAMVKQLTGAQVTGPPSRQPRWGPRVMAMAEDVPALQAMKPGGTSSKSTSPRRCFERCSPSNKNSSGVFRVIRDRWCYSSGYYGNCGSIGETR
jgi:hypothetical protein